ncbi:uncharacterized protein FIBRA_08039 [Fibroporia radiculosa]|uniref:Carbonic anhydrase n=1 Tax=Fibroporia radiculosa TaxID=599839 RepID=J4GW30_9APHY|nr:uncharacterized protein FIBRA_08039 [Fibroporia radiculosa]CCM05805.1 predicted protein [Fibroporia radiculosa]
MSSDTDPVLNDLLKKNEKWATDNKHLFPQDSQSPKVLWIGCVDSRVPESVVTLSQPGDILVHRNIANLFQLNDDSAVSALHFAVQNLKITRIVIVGHTDCGGVHAACRAAHDGTVIQPPCLARWLDPVVQLAQRTPRNFARLIEENVREQVKNVIKEIKNMSLDMNLEVRGWIYSVEDGNLRVLDGGA